MVLSRSNVFGANRIGFSLWQVAGEWLFLCRCFLSVKAGLYVLALW